MALKVSLEDYVKLQLAGATQTGVEFNGDTKLFREMTLAKPFEVYKCVENGPFVATKKFKVAKVRIAPESLIVISLLTAKDEVLQLDEVGLEKQEVTLKYAEKLIDDGNSMVRKGTSMLLSMLKNA